jgi:hypothetical protein
VVGIHSQAEHPVDTGLQEEEHTAERRVPVAGLPQGVVAGLPPRVVDEWEHRGRDILGSPVVARADNPEPCCSSGKAAQEWSAHQAAPAFLAALLLRPNRGLAHVWALTVESGRRSVPKASAHSTEQRSPEDAEFAAESA